MASRYTEEQLRVLEKHTIECQDVVDLLGDYAEGDMPSSLLARVDAHIEQCAVCQEERRGYFQVIELARELRDQPIDQKIARGVQQRLREALTRRLGISIPPLG